MLRCVVGVVGGSVLYLGDGAVLNATTGATAGTLAAARVRVGIGKFGAVEIAYSGLKMSGICGSRRGAAVGEGEPRASAAG